MKLVDDLLQMAPQMTTWRQTLHRTPELAFEEHETARFVAAQLRDAGLEPVEGLGGTGVVADDVIAAVYAHTLLQGILILMEKGAL